MDDELIDEFDGEEAIAYPKVESATSVRKSKPPPPVPSQPPHPPSMETTRKWKDVLVESGIPVEFAWKYALILSTANYDETNAHLLKREDLLRLKVGSNTQERKAILDTIAQLVREAAAAEEEEEQVVDTHHLVALRWRDLFKRAKLDHWGGKTLLEYANLLASQGWDENNAEDLDDEKLEVMGISNPAHREIIIELIERELHEAEMLTTLDRDFKDSKLIQAELTRKIEAFDVFQTRLSQILRGDTDKQREGRARRAREREERKEQRLARKLDRLMHS